MQVTSEYGCLIITYCQCRFGSNDNITHKHCFIKRKRNRCRWNNCNFFLDKNFEFHVAHTIVNASAVTSVTGLVQGVYQFELKVTDNNGATGRDTMQVTVNAAANIAPVANAGSDKTITLPANTVSLSGSGNDADGTISSFAWTKYPALQQAQ